ncbi:MAG: T9SS type A sorting domain-containing protein [Flavobacteriaceae bacterium]|nr:T9SS type A sorting domain-containing protein [Flavobacteriaceae bacterium]
MLRTDVDPVGQTVTVYPNFKIWDDNDDTPGTGEFDAEWNPYWFSSAGVPDKKVELNSFVEKNKTDNPEYFSQDITFFGNINSFGLTEPGYVVKVFVKVFVGDFSSNRTYEQVITGAGDFTLTAPGSEFTASDQVLQWGFQVYGLIADDALEPLRAPQAFGGIEFQDPALSVSEIQQIDYNVYPNPSNDTWNVKTNNVVISTVQVFNILGKQVMSLTPETTEVKIDASGLQAGMYIAKISTPNGVSNLRLVRK